MADFCLVPVGGHRSGVPIPISQDWAHSTGGLIIGRAAGAARIRIQSSTVSRDHARLRMQASPRSVWVEDLGSTNGTFLNGQRLAGGKAVRIGIGDKLRFGDVDYQLETHTAHAPPATTRSGRARPARVLSGTHPDTGEAILVPLEFEPKSGRTSLLIGRSPSLCDFAIRHPTVSRGGHARIFKNNERLMVCDVGSRNGVMVDGQLLKRGENTTLKDDSVLQLGAVKLVVARR